MGNRLKNRVALITGSGRGIGRAVALAMAKEGAKVATNDCDPGFAEAVVKEIAGIGGVAISFLGDVSKFKVANELVQTTVDNFGTLDILVNNAGVSRDNPIWDMTEEDWDYVTAVHLKGSFNCIRHACGIMKEQRWGRIINTTSPARLGLVWNSSYSTAKAGIVGLSKGVALDLSSYGITCNAYAPVAATRMTLSETHKARLAREYDSGAITKESYERKMNPPPPEAIPPLLVYLCTDEAADINGQVFGVRGQEIHVYQEQTKNSIVKNEGFWTVDELVELVPKALFSGRES